MNKVILMGRLTKDPEARMSNGGLTITRYSLAVDRRFKRDGEPTADFINCVAFGKAAEFAERYFHKGQRVAVAGRLQTRSWDDNNGQRHYSTEVILEEQEFAESKKESARNTDGTYAPSAPPANENWRQQGLSGQAMYPVDETDEDLPF